MADLLFFTGPMDCGKSTLALQMDHNQSSNDRVGRLFTCLDRSGGAAITSRIGLAHTAVHVEEDFNFWSYVVGELTGGRRVDYLICDEAQFYTRDQIDQLARVVDDLQIDVFTFGILADFRTELFPGSKRLVELADRVETLQVGQLCWCGQRATHNARTVDGRMVTEGSQVVVGDTDSDTGGLGEPQVRYEVLCRSHHRRRMTRQMARSILNPEPLPFDEETA